MKVYVTNPLSDGRWDQLAAWHPRASAFHQRGWLEALNLTYGYEPFVLTTAPPHEPLRDGIVLCRVSSWITGSRLVSLPFADHCEPLLDDVTDSMWFVSWLTEECDRLGYKYAELRPLANVENPDSALQPVRSYCFHELELAADLKQLFRGLHKDSIQRRIRRAERSQLSYERGCSKQLMNEFYGLLLMTRRRHHFPPQPRIWFRNLLDRMGSRVQIRLVRSNGTAIAAILTLQYRSGIVYKYGCSDQEFHNLGGMPFLFWRLIEESKAEGAEKIDFGRSDLDNPGLITFKDKFGTTKRALTYYRYSKSPSREASAKWGTQPIKQLFSVLPDFFLSAAGRVLYRHMG